ncbi:MAG TPA: RidA family protein [Candidatus Saccharimonadales bacterium]|nr:RidA family protein [Candidatus Saccharimonadales bacterium]
MQKQLVREQADRWHGTDGAWAQGYRAGNLVFLQGQTGLTLDGDLVAPHDPAGQARMALENIRTLMELAGGTLDDVVKIVVYVTEHAYRRDVYPIIGEFFGRTKPCSTGLVVKGLAMPELVVEIDAYAVIDDRSATTSDQKKDAAAGPS